MIETKIKKRKHWEIWSKPNAPTKPKEPPKTITVQLSNKFLFKKELYSYDFFALKDLDLSEDVPLNSLYFDFESEDDGYQITYNVSVYSRIYEEKENPNYKKQFKVYEKDLAKYKEKYKAYKEELKEYKLWLEQEKVDALQKRLEEAKEFIKAHEAK